MKIRLNNMPTPFEKKAIQAIRTRGMINRQHFDDIVNFLSREREGKRFQPIRPINEIVESKKHRGFV
jgi:hypothetical protein